MQTLCLMSGLTSTEWAAWVQAVGSIAAIVAAAWIATHQGKIQLRNALTVLAAERQTESVELGKTVAVLATNSAKMMKHVAEQLPDREAIHNAAEGRVNCDIGELARLDGYLRGIPLHTVPNSLVSLTMILGSTVRQFREKLEMVFRLHENMDAAMFDDFFNTMEGMNASIDLTCRDIETEVERLQA